MSTTDLRTSSTPPKTKIFVGRLPEEAQAPDLRRLFEQYGVVTECDILNRYGFVHMKTEEMAGRAIQELNNADFMGVQISVEQSTGKKSGRGGGGGGGGGGRGAFGPMRGRGAMRGMGRAPPYMRDGRDYDRRPGMPPPPSMRNGYYDNYDRGYDNYYPARGPPPPIMPSRERDPDRRSYPEMMRSPYERRSFSEVGRSPYDRPSLPPVATFERRSEYGGSRISSDIYRRRTPPPTSSYGVAGYDRENMDPYGPAGRRYERDNMDPYGPPARRYLATGTSFRCLAFSFRMGCSTIAKFVREILFNLYTEDFRMIAERFNTTWRFPNCRGSLDGKHVRIKCPAHSGSMYFYYKQYFSIVQGLVVDHYKFVLVDIGSFGKQSDGTLQASVLGQLMRVK